MIATRNIMNKETIEALETYVKAQLAFNNRLLADVYMTQPAEYAAAKNSGVELVARLTQERMAKPPAPPAPAAAAFATVKGLILAGLVGLAALVAAKAGQAPLAWDYPADAATNFWIYGNTNPITASNLSSAPVRVSTRGTNQTFTVTGLSTGVWFFAVTAVSSTGLESDPSTNTWGQLVNAPSNVRIVILQYQQTH